MVSKITAANFKMLERGGSL